MDEYVKLSDVLLAIRVKSEELARNEDCVERAKKLDLHGIVPMIRLLSTQSVFTVEEVAEILAEACGDECACNLNGNDEWLPGVCELHDKCPSPGGAKCWEQFIKHRGRKNDA